MPLVIAINLTHTQVADIVETRETFLQILRTAFADAQAAAYPTNQLIFQVEVPNPIQWATSAAEQAVDTVQNIYVDLFKQGVRVFRLDGILSLEVSATGKTEQESALQPLARIMRALEHTHQRQPGSLPPVYRLRVGASQPVSAQAVPSIGQLEQAQRVFEWITEAAGIPEISSRLLSVDVHAGTGYSSQQVKVFTPRKTAHLAQWVAQHPNIALGGGAVDFQLPSAVQAMRADGFRFFQLSDALYVARREALVALSIIENTTMIGRPGVFLSNWIGEIDKAMQQDSTPWKDIYPGNGFDQLLQRKFSLIDRTHRFMNEDDVRNARQRLFKNFEEYPAPLMALHQFFPHQFDQVIMGSVRNTPQGLIETYIAAAFEKYCQACGWKRKPHD